MPGPQPEARRVQIAREMLSEFEAPLEFGAAPDFAGEWDLILRVVAILLQEPNAINADDLDTADRVTTVLRDASPDMVDVLFYCAFRIGNSAALRRGRRTALLWLNVARDAIARGYLDHSDLREFYTDAIDRAFSVADAGVGQHVDAPALPPVQDDAPPLIQAMRMVMQIIISLNSDSVAAEEIEGLPRLLTLLDSNDPLESEASALLITLASGLRNGEWLERWSALRRAASIPTRSGAHAMPVATMELNALQLAIGHGRIDLALESLVSIFRLSRSTHDGPSIRWLAAGALALGLHERQRFDAACAVGKLAVTDMLVERRKHADFDPELETLDGVAKDLVDRVLDLHVQAGRLSEAAELSLIFLANGVAAAPGPVASEREGWLLGGFDEALAKGADAVADLLDNFERMTPPSAPVSVPDRAEPGQAFLAFLDQGRGIQCLIVQHGLPSRTVQLEISSHEANTIAFELRQAILDRGADTLAVLQRGYTALIRQIVATLSPDVTLLNIAAPAGLQMVPWAALHDGQAFLVEQFAFRRATMIDKRGGEQPCSRVHLASFVATRAHGTAFAALGESALREAREVARRANGGVFVDDDFREELLRHVVASANVLHIASHFKVEPSNLGSSRLLLGDGGTLTLAQLLGLGLSGLELLILSACDTSVTGETPSGAFAIDALLTAQGGAHAVVGTLWPVDTEAMAAVMPRFIEHLATGMDKAEALAVTQREMVDGRLGHGSLAHPEFFAAPVFCGAVRPIPASAWPAPP